MNSCSLRGSPWRRRLVDDVRERLFSPASDQPGGARYGAEVELIPLHADTGAPVPIAADEGGPGTLAFLGSYGGARGWRVVPGPHGVPTLELPGGGRIAYEPGGQIEYATPPRATVAEVVEDLDGVLPPLVAAGGDAGIRLLGQGIDPVNPLDRARLLLPGERYAAMHRYLTRIGDAGPRMMLQTAAIQVNVELADAAGNDADLRWRVLNAATPHLTAMFANSPAYAGEKSGFASFRARQWRRLDRRRTGILGREPDPAAEYTDFGLEAGWIFGPGDREPEPFLEWVLRGEATVEDWRTHLTTLFPEVRPRGYLEIRCIDALPPEWCAAPIAVVAGILADGAALRDAAEIVGAPDSALLQDAARFGLADPRLARGAAELFTLALRAGERSGAVDGRALEVARAFYEAYTAGGRSPGDEAVGAAA